MLLWNDGTPIQAYGDNVFAFQSTEKQYNAHNLFGDVVPLFQENQYARDRRSWEHIFDSVYGDSATKKHKKQIYKFYKETEKNNFDVGERLKNDYYHYSGTGEVAPVYPEDWIGVGGSIKGGINALAKRFPKGNKSALAKLQGGKLVTTPQSAKTLGTKTRVTISEEKISSTGLSGNFSGSKPLNPRNPYNPEVVNQCSAEFYKLYGDGNPKRGSLNNYDTRRWYLKKDASIDGQLNQIHSYEQQAKDAFDLRNKYRTKARIKMQDRVSSDRLMREPNLTWEKMLNKTEDKLKDRGIQNPSNNQMYLEIIESSKRSRQSINQQLGIKP